MMPLNDGTVTFKQVEKMSYMYLPLMGGGEEEGNFSTSPLPSKLYYM